jgi:2-dehydro-3-deoxy-D-gluconate 5-dehydrogenase
MNPLFDLTGKTAVVTGAGTGLGLGMSHALAAAGADLVMVDLMENEEALRAVRAHGHGAVPVIADLSSTKPVGTIIATALKEFSRIDILVNNAGIIRRQKAIDFTEKDWDDVMAVNARSLFFLAQAAAREMMKRRYGKIVNIASLLSFQGGILVPSYAASKAAVAQVTKAMANEWAEFGITANAIAPGYMATDNTRALREDPVRSQAILQRIPAGRWGLPDDLAGAVVFLSSPASDYVNGHVLVVDGGWLAR